MKIARLATAAMLPQHTATCKKMPVGSLVQVVLANAIHSQDTRHLPPCNLLTGRRLRPIVQKVSF